MKITKAKLKQIIMEELSERIGLDPQHAEQMKLRAVADKVVVALGHPTQVRFDDETKTYYIQNSETQAIMMDAKALHALMAAGFVPLKKNIDAPEGSEEDDDIGHDWAGGTGKNLPFNKVTGVKNFRGSE